MKAQDPKSFFKRLTVGSWFCQTEHKNQLVQFSPRRLKCHPEQSLFTLHAFKKLSLRQKAVSGIAHHPLFSEGDERGNLTSLISCVRSISHYLKLDKTLTIAI